MNETNPGPNIRGAKLYSLNALQATAWLNWLTDPKLAPQETYHVSFALAHCDAGVTWGYYSGQKKWRLGNSVDPVLCPLPTLDTLYELRLFGTQAEVLIWRLNSGKLYGRILSDDESTLSENDPLRPLEEARILRGKPANAKIDNGFIRYTDLGGVQHIVPATFPRKFSVRHYLEQDTKSGAVRIASTRLVGHCRNEGTAQCPVM